MSREHAERVLEHQAKIAAEHARGAPARDPQLNMPLIVEVKSAVAKRPARRRRRKSGLAQPDLAPF